MNFDVKATGNKSTRERTLIKTLQSPGLRVPASGVSKTLVLSSDLDELCDRIKLLLEERQAGNNSDLIKDEIIAIADKVLEYRCISRKQPKQLLIK